MIDCRGPLQTDRSRRREKENYAHIILSRIELVSEIPNAIGREPSEWRLARGHVAAGVEVHRSREHEQRCSRDADVFALHTHLAVRLAMRFASN